MTVLVGNHDFLTGCKLNGDSVLNAEFCLEYVEISTNGDYLAKMTIDVKEHEMTIQTTVAASVYSIDPESGYKMAVIINATLSVWDDMGTRWNIFDDKRIYFQPFPVGATKTTSFGCGDGFYDVDTVITSRFSIPNETDNDLYADLLTLNLSLSVSTFSYEQTALALHWEASRIILSLSIDEPGGLDYADGSFTTYY